MNLTITNHLNRALAHIQIASCSLQNGELKKAQELARAAAIIQTLIIKIELGEKDE